MPRKKIATTFPKVNFIDPFLVNENVHSLTVIMTGMSATYLTTVA